LHLVIEQWTRLTGSKWTITYITVAAFQMVFVIALEGIIFGLNHDISQQLSRAAVYEREHISRKPDQYEKPGYGYAEYHRQFQSITHSNVWFMVFQAFVFALCVTSVSVRRYC
jgi:hypothetical protein